MKPNLLFIPILLAGLAAASCSKVPDTLSKTSSDSSRETTGTVSIVLCTGDEPSPTKALSAYTGAQDYETNINSVQLLLFNSDGDIVKDLRFSSSFNEMVAIVPVGPYTVYAFVNTALKDVYNECELSDPYSYRLSLSENSISDSNFIMCGSASCTVDESSTAVCPISVSRIVGRVALNAINIDTPSGYEVYLRCAFLSNVCGESAALGSALETGFYQDSWEDPVWYNYDGYNALATDMDSEFAIIDRGNVIVEAADAQLSDLTSYDISSGYYLQGESWSREDGALSHVLFYGCPNASALTPSGQHTVYEAQRTCLVVCADVYSGFGNGGTYYYTVPLSSFEANKTYTVELTITGFGSSDPNTPVEKGSMSASVSISGWSAGDVLEKTV